MKALLAALAFFILSPQPSVTLKAQWDPVPDDPTSFEVVDHYAFTLDSQPVVNVPTTVDASCACVSFAFSAGTGSHTVKVVAVDTFGQSSAPASASFSLKGGPDGIKNLKIGR